MLKIECLKCRVDGYTRIHFSVVAELAKCSYYFVRATWKLWIPWYNLGTTVLATLETVAVVEIPCVARFSGLTRMKKLSRVTFTRFHSSGNIIARENCFPKSYYHYKPLSHFNPDLSAAPVPRAFSGVKLQVWARENLKEHSSQERNEGGKGGTIPGRRITMMAPKSPNNVTSRTYEGGTRGTSYPGPGHFIIIQPMGGTTWFWISFLFTYVCSYKFLGELTPILQKLIKRFLIYHCFIILPLDGIRIDEQHKNEYNARSASPGVPNLSLTMYPFSIPSLILTTHSE